MSISKKRRFSIIARDSFTCRYCGRSAPSVELEVDHRHPRSKGGQDHADNLVTACYDCNRGKAATVLPTALEAAQKDAHLVRMRWLCDAMDGLGCEEWGPDIQLLIWRVMDGPGRHLVRAMDAMREAMKEKPLSGPEIVEVMLNAMSQARRDDSEAENGG